MMKLGKKHGGLVLIVMAVVIAYFVWKKYKGQTPSTTATGIPGAQYS